MKKQIIITLAALAAAALAAPASAQFYVAGGVGASNTTGVNSSGIVGGVNYSINEDKNKTSGKIVFGYNFTPMWGVEVQYVDLGKRDGSITLGAPLSVTRSATSAKATEVGIAATGTFALENNFFLFGKIGVSSNKIDDTSVTYLGVTYSTNRGSKSDVLAGVGLGYNFTKNIGMMLEYEYFGKFSDNSGSAGKVKGNNVALDLRYSF